MSNKKTAAWFYHKKAFKVTAGVLLVAVFFTMVLQPAIFIAIKSSTDKADAAVNYLAGNTEYVNKNTPERVLDYLETFTPRETLADYYQLASTQIAQEEYAEALANIEKCIGLYNNEGNELYVDLLLKRGCLQVMLGEYAAALESLDVALAEDPAAADIYLVKAQIYAERQDMAALTQCLTAYLQLAPEDSSIRALLAQAQFTEGDYQTATQQYAEILETDPNAEIEYLYGLTAVKNSDFAAGEASLTKAIAKEDNFDGIYYYRGVCRMSLGNYPGAIEDLTASIAREDMLQASYYTRGVCLLLNNEYEKGLLDIEHAAGRNDDEEITKQAQLLIDELMKAAQSGETVKPELMLQPEKSRQAAEMAQPGAAPQKEAPE